MKKNKPQRAQSFWYKYFHFSVYSVSSVVKFLKQTTSLCLLAVSLFLFSSCPDNLQLPEKLKLPELEIELEEGKGSLSLYIDEIASSRSILPQNTDWSSFTGDFRIAISGEEPILRTINNLSAPIQLDAGNYTVTVTALNDTAPIAKGEASITITAGTPEAHIIKLSAIMEANTTGTFNWNLTIPVSSFGQLRITQAADNTQVGAIENLQAGSNTGNRNLSSGYYFVTTTLSRTNHADIVRRDVLHVYQNMTSVFTIEFSDVLFNNNLHNVIFDHGYGGLSDSIPVIHGDKVMHPANPTRPGYEFENWYTDAALTTLYNFDTSVSIGFSLYAAWEFKGSVSVTSGTATTYHANLDAAFNSITTAGNYTVTLLEDQTMTANRTIGANQNITIVGEETRTIAHGITDTIVTMFTINNAASSLTLGNNVTIQGRSTAGTGDLIFIQSGTFKMLEGSKITGHQLDTSGVNSSVVFMSGTNPIFEMSGGIINGNNNIPGVVNANTGSGVYMGSGTFTMTGGSITGNSPVDIFINSAATFNLSGNAVVGNIRLNTTSAVSNAIITLGAFTGTVGTLSLRGENSTMNTVISWWESKQVIQAASGYNLIAADIAKFTLGNFYLITLDNAQTISSTHMIGTSGADLGRLITKPKVTVNNGMTTTNFDTLTAAFTFIDTQVGSFIITLLEDQTMTTGRTIGAGQDITIIGAGGVRTINGNNLAAATVMFTISNATASLTFGENITVQGRTEAGAGAVVNMSAGLFTMQGNSRIQGHNLNGTFGAVHLTGGTFNMQNNSVISGVTASTATSAAVHLNAATATFNMEGGQITANSNSLAVGTTTGNGGVTVTNGIFNMTGGSVTGNTHSGEASDVYHANTSANSFTVSSNAEIGALKLNASSSAAATVSIGAAGWTGEITTLNLRGGTATITTALGYWNGRQVFNGITAAQIARIELGQFISNNNARQAISPTYMISTEGADLGRLLLVNPAVTVTVNDVTTGYTDLTAALNAITTAGNYTVTLLQNQTMTAGHTISNTGRNITIVGSGARTITHEISNAADHMFSFTMAALTSSLTLGENITVQGRTTTGAGAVVNNEGGTFRMLPGSRITGHVSNAAAGGTVRINGDVAIAAIVTFEMQGGSIDGNSNTSGGAATSTGSGGVSFTSGTFIMSGGSITGNRHGTAAQVADGTAEASDVYHAVTNADRFTVSGNATIGELKLSATSTTAGATVNIGTGWSGSIIKLNLRGGNNAIATSSSYWTDRTAPIFNDITAAQVARVGLGDFISGNNARQTISNTHYINASGVLTVLPDSAVVVNGNPFGNLSLALDSTAAAGTYLIEVFMNQNLAPQSLTGSGRNITITSPTGAEVQLSANGRLFTVNSGVTLTLGGGITLRGRSGNNAPLITNSGGTLIIDGATITGNQSTGEGTGVYGTSGSITMKSGTISFNTTTGGGGGGVTLNGGLTFRMEGGIITDNSSNAEGGGICGFNSPTVIISGGIIQRNTARAMSAGVYTNSGSFTKTGNSIITGWGDDQVNGNVVRDISGAVVSGANHAIRTGSMTSANTVGAGVNTP